MPSLVFLNFDMPYSISGITERNYHGTGLIVDAERGLVVTDRAGKIGWVHSGHHLFIAGKGLRC